MSSHLLLVDASGFAYRSYATANPVYRPSDGQPVGATLRFLELLWRLLGAARDDQPTHGAAVFDPSGKTYRHSLFQAYKSRRPEARALEIKAQFPFMKHGSEALGLTSIEIDGWEADDVLATLADRAAKAGMRTTIVSSDKDMAQLVVDGITEIYDPLSVRDNGYRGRRILAADIEKKFGVPPHQMADLQALAGDTVDDIPGVTGIGMKTAAGLIRRFGSLDAVLKNVDDCRQASLRHELRKPKTQKLARLCLKLTTLRRDVEVPVTLESMILHPIMHSHIKEILHALEAPHYAEAIFALDPQLARVVEPVEDPEAWYREELKFPNQPVPQLPQAGFYKRVLVKGGPYVAARIWRAPHIDLETNEPSGMEVLHCEVGGRARDPFAEWVRLSMTPIKRGDYNYEIKDAEHARMFRPGDPKANPRKRPDLLKSPAPHNPKPIRRKS